MHQGVLVWYGRNSCLHLICCHSLSRASRSLVVPRALLMEEICGLPDPTLVHLSGLLTESEERKCQICSKDQSPAIKCDILSVHARIISKEDSLRPVRRVDMRPGIRVHMYSEIIRKSVY